MSAYEQWLLEDTAELLPLIDEAMAQLPGLPGAMTPPTPGRWIRNLICTPSRRRGDNSTASGRSRLLSHRAGPMRLLSHRAPREVAQAGPSDAIW
ncbi:hypothetical protein [Aeromicrobium sp. UC242_57]|uniref:hypothetical protein n=1 Tax=Aeromicrobium sp. UC242_57 TaxID=3374624 RepID=UPI0037A0D5EA